MALLFSVPATKLSKSLNSFIRWKPLSLCGTNEPVLPKWEDSKEEDPVILDLPVHAGLLPRWGDLGCSAYFFSPENLLEKYFWSDFKQCVQNDKKLKENISSERKEKNLLTKKFSSSEFP